MTLLVGYSSSFILKMLCNIKHFVHNALLIVYQTAHRFRLIQNHGSIYNSIAPFLIFVKEKNQIHANTSPLFRRSPSQ